MLTHAYHESNFLYMSQNKLHNTYLRCKTKYKGHVNKKLAAQMRGLLSKFGLFDKTEISNVHVLSGASF